MKEEDRIRVLSTTGMIHDVVSQVGGDRIVALCLFGGEIDPHSYEMVKGDAEKLMRAQLIFCNGLGLEHGASLRYQLEHHEGAIALGQKIASKFPDQMIWVDGELDPHVWMSLSLWSEIIDPIVEALSALDPEGRALFEANGARVRAAIEGENEFVRTSLHKIPSSRRYLVTSHDAFNYFARAYLADRDEARWKERVMAPEGLAPDGQMSSKDIQELIDHLQKYEIHILFPESNVSPDPLKKIAQASRNLGLEVEVSRYPLYGDAMGHMTYLEMMRYNARVLCEAWESR